MNLKTAKGQLRRLSERLNYTVLVSIVLMVSNLGLVYLSWYALSHQKRIVTPFNSSRGYVVSDADVDPAYLDLMSIDLLDTHLNVTPENVDENNKLLLSYIDSSQYAKILEDLNHEAKVIKKDKISSAFYRHGMKSDAKELSTIVVGTLNRWVGYRPLSTVKKTYVLHYNYRFGRLTLKAIEEVLDEKN